LTRVVAGDDPRPVAFLSEQGKQRLSAAVEAVEARSRAELVVVVRPSAGNYLGNDLIPAVTAMLATTALLLYTPWVFDLHWFLIHPPLVAAATVAVLRVVPGLRRMFIGEAHMQREAEMAAAAWFYRKGVRHTRERTGMLIYVALLERRVVVLADSGITEVVPEHEWAEALAPITAVLDEGGDLGALAERLEGLAETLARWCEAREDDFDELPNAIDTGAAA
jgi:putative membrane protein